MPLKYGDYPASSIVKHVKKLLSCGVDLMPWRRGSGVRAGLADLRCQNQVSNSERVNADVYQDLYKRLVVQPSLADISWRKIPVLFPAVQTARTTQQFLVEFRTLADWLPYLPDLYLLDFFIWSVFKTKSPGDASCKSAVLRSRNDLSSSGSDFPKSFGAGLRLWLQHEPVDKIYRNWELTFY